LVVNVSPRRVIVFFTFPVMSYTKLSRTAMESVHGWRLTTRPKRS